VFASAIATAAISAAKVPRWRERPILAAVGIARLTVGGWGLETAKIAPLGGDQERQRADCVPPDRRRVSETV